MLIERYLINFNKKYILLLEILNPKKFDKNSGITAYV